MVDRSWTSISHFDLHILNISISTAFKHKQMVVIHFTPAKLTDVVPTNLTRKTWTTVLLIKSYGYKVLTCQSLSLPIKAIFVCADAEKLRT
jgi:hypothetical protein